MKTTQYVCLSVQVCENNIGFQKQMRSDFHFCIPAILNGENIHQVLLIVDILCSCQLFNVKGVFAIQWHDYVRVFKMLFIKQLSS